MSQGYLALVLHAHLPYIRHPEHEEFLEEDWLFEAMTETYLPLIHMWESLASDNTPFAMSMTVTPTLMEMLADPLLQARYVRYLDRRIELMAKELERTKETQPAHRAAGFYAERYAQCRTAFLDTYGSNLVRAFRKFQDLGNVEILTCAATHGLLPLMLTPNAVRGQVATAARAYERHMGRPPKGIWLPECAFRVGIDHILGEFGLTHFLVDTHGVLNAYPTPPAGVHAPVRLPSGVAAFGRDLESSKQVWSSEEGYPGDADYREFYRDLGYDADYDHIQPYLHPDGVRRNLGVKYHRVTGKVDLSQKDLYDVDRAIQRAEEHAGHFLWCREHQIKWLGEHLDCAPVVVAPYDAELYGHWWFEGPHFLEQFFRKAQYAKDAFQTVTLQGYLDRHESVFEATPSTSSWGNKGYFEVWLNGANDWIYRHLHRAERRLGDLARAHASSRGAVADALNQAARELLLAQSSDWAFIMSTGTTVPYAHRRTREHVHRFNVLCDEVEQGAVKPETAKAYCGLNPLFPDVDFRDWK